MAYNILQSELTSKLRAAYPEDDALSEIKISMDCGLEAFCAEFPGGKTALSPTLTLTGSLEHACAMTAREYIEKTWPGFVDILDAISTLVQDRNLDEKHGAVCWDPAANQPVSTLVYRADSQIYSGNKTLLRLEAHGKSSSLRKVAELLAWIGCYFRPPLQGPLSCSRCDIVQKGRWYLGCEFEIVLRPLVPIRYRPAHHAWHQIFKSCVVACDFPVPKRSLVRGLEVSGYALLFALARVQCPMSYRGGIIWCGYSTALVPMVATADSIQWAFVASRSDREELDMDEVERRYPAVLQNSGDLALENYRHFIG